MTGRRRNRNLLLVVIALVASANAKFNPSALAVAALHKAHPEIEWNEKSAVIADVDCDGKSEVIVLGAESGQVVVAVVSVGNLDQQRLLKFPVRPDAEDGFCAVPNRVKVSRLECSTDEGPLPGCKPIRSCKEFTVADDDCDSFNFYWDASRKTFGWWRR